ncbi:MAG TPA: TonB family protein [Candidatus Angelobacter sp.]|nr:TonB family protein [Candidatus Angelobacter sp.]
MRPATQQSTAPFRGLQFLIEPEPWLRVFARNLRDLFRPAPPPVWITAKPAEYWRDALVHRPVAWRAARQSFLGHVLVILAIYALNLMWLDQPALVTTLPSHSSPLRYQLSEYLPPVTPHAAKPAPPRRARPQPADPEYSVQEIVVTNESHISTRQTIVQPNPMLLKQDVPLPNLVVNAQIPGAPVVSNRRLRELPLADPEVAPPTPEVASNLHPLIFPPTATPVVAAPSTPVAGSRPVRALPLEGPLVVPPAPDSVARNPQALQIPAQSPPQVAAPAADVASGSGRPLSTQTLPMSAPQVAPPAPSAVGGNISRFGLPSADATAAPPAQPVSTGGSAREKDVGQLLVLNAQPAAPAEPIKVPEGNRPGEFAAGPQGRPGASALPEIAAGTSAPAANRPGSDSGNTYISAPPVKITANAVVAAPPPAARPLTPDKTDGRPATRIDTQVFGARRHYSMRLSMPNLSSSVGSWTVRFAELNATGPAGDDLSAPEAITKVDPAYPQDLMQDRIEGVVVLYAIIRSDGSVDGVRVLDGFDERLNENARKALQQWKFRPGTKNGQPVDIEAVVRVPFRVRRNSF